MVVAIDIGGTKTLIALATSNGKVIHKQRLASIKNYPKFIQLLTNQIKSLDTKSISLIVIGCAGIIDRKKGVIKNSPNLRWLNKPLCQDINKTLKGVKIILENDANLAGLYEANKLKNAKQKVLYLTFGTGVGTAYINQGSLVPELLDGEGGHMVFESNGRMLDWESFSAGRTIVKKYDKKAADLNSVVAWNEIAQSMAIGLVDNCAVFPADTVIIGGSIGTYFKKYRYPLKKAVKKLIKKSIMLKMPKIIGAKDAEGAVILGGLVLAKQYEQHR